MAKEEETCIGCPYGGGVLIPYSNLTHAQQHAELAARHRRRWAAMDAARRDGRTPTRQWGKAF